MPEVTPLVIVPDDLLAENSDFLVTEAGDNFITESTFTNALTATTAEAPTTSESCAAVRTPRSITGTATDALSTTEAATASRGAQSLSRTATDAISTSEAATGTRAGLSITRTATDALTTAESAAAIRTPLSVTRTATDALATSEAAAAARTPRSITGTATDALATAEAVTRIGSFKRIGGDTIATAENATATKFAFLVRSTADALTTSDAANRVGSFHPAAIDAISTGEATAKAASHPRSTTDAPTTAESVIGSKFGVKTGTATDALTIAQVVTGTRTTQSISRTTADALTTAEATGKTATHPRTATDSIATADAVIRSIVGAGGTAYTRTATDALVTSEFLPGLADGAAVTSWPDGSGNGHDAVSTGSPPIYHTSILNGKPGILFDGSTTFLRIAANAGMQSANYTVFAVVKTVPSGGIQGTVLTEDFAWDTGGGDGNVRYEFGYGVDAASNVPNFVVGHYNGAWATAQAPTADANNTGYLYSGTYNGSALSLYRSGTQIASTATTLATAGVGNWWVGRRHDNYPPAAPYFNGYLMELYAFDSALSSTNRANIEKWLGDKYGFTVAGGTAVDPTTISGLQLYLLADAFAPTSSAVAVVKPSIQRTATESLRAVVGLPGLSDGDPVTSWPISAGGATGAVFTGAIGTATTSPIFKLAALNGRDLVRLALTTDGMGSNFTNFVGNAPNTVFVVFKQTTGYPGGYPPVGPIHCHGFSGSYSYELGCENAAGYAAMYNNVDPMISGSTYIQGSYHIVTGIENVPAAYLFVDGTQVASSSTYTFQGVGNIYLGCLPAYGVPWLGDVAEIIVYSGALSSTDRANIEKGLADFYGLSVAGGTAVDPTTVTGLQAWWRASTLGVQPGVDVVIRAGIVRTATDALATSEVTSKAATHPRTTTDASTTADAATRSIVLGGVAISRTATDALATSEVTGKAATHPRTTTDNPATAEAVAKTAAHPRSVTDALTTADSAGRVASIVRATTDAPTTTEVTIGTKFSLVVRTATDAPTINEAAVRTLVGSRAATDALATAEAISKAATHPRTTTDASATAEAATGIRGALSVTRTATDALTTAEAITKSATHPRTATDAPTTADVASKTAIQTRTTTDALVIAETVTAIRTGAGVFARSTVEAPTTSEAATWKLTALRTAADAPHTAEIATGVRLGLSITRTATDAIATAETSTGVRTPRSQTRTATDALTTADAVAASKFGIVIRNATDALVANLVSNRVLVAGRTTGEALTVAMAANRRWVGARVATDMLTAVDSAMSEGTAFLFIAGQVAGSTPYVTSAGSKLRIVSTNSDLDATVAGSNVKAPRTGSGLKVEKTNGYHTY